MEMGTLKEKTRHPIHLRPPDREKLRILLPCLARFGCAFVFTAASLRGEYLPLGICMLTVSGPGLYGLSALMGVCLGAVLLWGGSTAMELIAVAILIRSSVWVFRGTEAAKHPLFFPVAAALMAALIGGVLLLAGGLPTGSLTFYVLRILLCFGGSWLMGRALTWSGRTPLLLLTGGLVLSAQSIAPFGLSLGVLLGTLFTVCAAGSPSGLAMAAVCGIALDLTMAMTVPMTVLFTLVALAAGPALRRSRSLAAALTAAILFGGLLLSGRESAPVLWAALPGAALGWLVPGGFWQPPEKQPRRLPLAVLHMQTASVLLSDLGGRMLENLPEMAPADPSKIFDRAADRVCKSCALFSTCWSGACEAYDALCGAAAPMLQRGAVLRDDFPVSFLARCRHIEGLLSAINQELDGVLYRRQFRHRLEESRSLLAEQYRIFAAYLDGAVAAFSGETRKKPVCSPVLGVASAGRKGSAISGDRGASFRTARHLHYVLLCDGMGSGPDAMEESLSSVRLLRGLLTAGFQPEDALQLLNGIYLLRGDGAFSTVDLLQADLSTGEVTLWKWGSAPSYLRTAEGVQKIGTAQPPPGLEGTGRAERFQLSLGAGEFLVLLSDGAAGPETEELIRSYGGRSPKELAASIVGQGGEEEDDRTAAVLKLQPAVSQRQHTTACT